MLALVVGCNGDGGGGPVPPVTLELLCEADTPVGADQIGLECPATGEGDLVITVVIGGPSTASDIYGVKFDLVFDSVVLAFEARTALASFLARNGGSVGALASVDESDPNRLVVAVALQGAPGGVPVTTARDTVIGLLFRGLDRGTSTIRFENGEVVDSSLNPIASIEFVGALHVEAQ